MRDAPQVLIPEWVTHEFLVALADRTREKMSARAAETALPERTLVELVLDWWEAGPRARATGGARQHSPSEQAVEAAANAVLERNARHGACCLDEDEICLICIQSALRAAYNVDFPALLAAAQDGPA